MLERFRNHSGTTPEPFTNLIPDEHGEEVTRMPRVVVYTDSGEAVWSMEKIESWQINGLTCPGNVRGSSLAAGLRRAVSDAEKIQRGEDPERPSEKAMRLASGG
jgi:hypothetical protein